MIDIKGQKYETDVYTGRLLSDIIISLNNNFCAEDIVLGNTKVDESCVSSTDYIHATIFDPIEDEILITVWVENVSKYKRNVGYKITVKNNDNLTCHKYYNELIERIDKWLKDYFDSKSELI